jgi:nucleoside-diphosphate-sugar epimerase
MKQLFLTGITGLLGSGLADLLLSRGYHLIAPVRRKASCTDMVHPNLQLIEGSLFDDYSEYLRNVETVIHAAAETRQDLPRYSPYWQTNCNATIQLFNSARMCGVKTFIFVSTANTIGHGPEDDLGNETKKISFPFNRSFYAKSKLEAEMYLVANNNEVRTVIINPGFMIGPGGKQAGSNRIIRMGLRKKLLFYPPGGKSFVHVRDVVQAIHSAMEKGISGENYLIVHENLSYRQFFEQENRVARQSPAMIGIPSGILKFMGSAGNLMRRLGVRTEWCSVHMDILCTRNFYSNRKSVRELGIKYTPVSKAIHEYIKEPPRHEGTKMTQS